MMQRDSLLITSLAIVLGILSVGCKEIRYVSTPEYHRDTIRVTDTRVDSVTRYDSICVRIENDTLYIEKVRYRDRYRNIRDSVYISKTDTITVVKEVEMEKTLTFRDRFKIRFGGYAIGLLLAIVVAIILYIYYKLKP